MTNPGGNPMDAVAGLMLERQRFEVWLAQLEAKRAITPPHVFERVRADYEARLKSVIEQLSGRTSELKETIAALTTRLATLQKEEGRLRDERYEAELRAAVGEYTPEQWKELVANSDAELARRSSDRANVSAEIARLQQILSMSGGRAAEASAPGAADNGVPAAAPAPSPAAPAAAAPPAGPNFDELAFLKSVIDPRTEAAAAAAAAAAAVAPATVPPPAPAAPSAPPAADPGATSAPRARPSAPVQTAPTEEKPPAERVPEPEVPAFLKDVPVDDVKTLRCAECGSMNFPTEWYCERCGAELTSM